MTINRYDKGDVVRVEGPFTDQNGDHIDPTNVFFTFRNPAGVSTTFTYGEDEELVKSSTGNYRVDLNASMSGNWYWRWHSEGAGQAADKGQFFVEPSAL